MPSPFTSPLTISSPSHVVRPSTLIKYASSSFSSRFNIAEQGRHAECKVACPCRLNVPGRHSTASQPNSRYSIFIDDAPWPQNNDGIVPVKLYCGIDGSLELVYHPRNVNTFCGTKIRTNWQWSLIEGSDSYESFHLVLVPSVDYSSHLWYVTSSLMRSLSQLYQSTYCDWYPTIPMMWPGRWVMRRG